MVAAFNFISNQ